MAYTTAAATTTTVEIERKTYWCHECDMSITLNSSSSPSSSLTLLCPHCHTHFLELMDSPHPEAVDPFPTTLSSSLSLFDTPADDLDEEDDDYPFPLLFPTNSLPTSKASIDSIPTIRITSSLLEQLDPEGIILCAICKDPIAIDAHGKQLPCKHLYHSDCIFPWLVNHNSCPLCRFQLPGIEKEEAFGTTRFRRQLRIAMMRLTEYVEEEEDLYGFRTTLRHIANRHGLISSATDRQSDADSSLFISPTQMADAETRSVGSTGGVEGILGADGDGDGDGDGDEQVGVSDMVNDEAHIVISTNSSRSV
ncbi:E3 ubiquitin-protein ligase RING1-like protein [Quillaja saponaria]|uniref:RING-type E3 ubiquitin transferase n=1 Tax=Quillaja saponaria TaxID=32244 RepID=A0AAD7QIK1_QUISA|nr:E3 ubiquitin-protein ligase RING1-like protein [Quillaja saponaria]